MVLELGRLIWLEDYTPFIRLQQSFKSLFPRQILCRINSVFSNNGEYQVHKAYVILSRKEACQAHSGWWRSFWKIKVPLKISNFVWKLLNNCLPTFLNLHIRGISTGNLCPTCNEEEESLTHFFLLYPFTRACWHGNTLAIHTSDLNNLFVQLWLKQLISRHDLRDLDSMYYLQDVFITLWTIWNYQNKVVHQGIIPNRMDVILIAQNFSCRYKDSLSSTHILRRREGRCSNTRQ